jgi:hypothetical protein
MQLQQLCHFIKKASNLAVFHRGGCAGIGNNIFLFAVSLNPTTSLLAGISLQSDGRKSDQYL